MFTTAFSHILLQFLDESSFLWERYNFAVTAPHYDAEKLTELKERLEAQLDGLLSSEENGWVAVLERISDNPMPGDIFTSSWLAIESTDSNRLDTVLQTITKPNHAPELASALTWFSFDRARPFCERLLSSSSPLLQLAGLSTYAASRKNPNNYLGEALQNPDPLLRCCALKMIGELNLRDKLQIAKKHFSDEDPVCAFRAAWSASLLEDKSAIKTLLQFVDRIFSFADEAVMMAVRKAGSQNGPAIIHELTKMPDKLRWAVMGAGALGDVTNIPWLLDMMKQTGHSRVAGEAFSTITGFDIVNSHMDTDAPEDFEETPSDDLDDERVDLDADHFLPWPDVNKIRTWWEEHCSEFVPGSRYLCGKPINTEALYWIIRNGYQRQRYAASIELMALNPGIALPILETLN